MEQQNTDSQEQQIHNKKRSKTKKKSKFHIEPPQVEFNNEN